MLLFGGIGVFAAVLYVLLGVWLWRRAKEFVGEVDRAGHRVELALAVDPVSGSSPTAEIGHSTSPNGSRARWDGG